MGGDKEKFDLTEEGSKRADDESTALARNLESNDFNTSGGTVSSPEGDSAAENKVATSIDDE